jgi:hypothetical protein
VNAIEATTTATTREGGAEPGEATVTIAIFIVLTAINLISQAILINELRKGLATMANATAEITAAVENITNVVEAATVAFQELSKRLQDAANEPAAVQALAAKLNADAAKLAAAITANTPSDEATGQTNEPPTGDTSSGAPV